MIALASLCCQRPPELKELSLELGPGELPVVVGPSAAEREALVELLAGFRTESSGEITRDGAPLPPRARRSVVVVLPRHPALTPELSVVDHLRLVARFKGGTLREAALQEVLAFSGIDRAGRRPPDLDPDQKLRLTLALAVAAAPVLVVAHDPPPEVLRLLGALRAPERAVLAVVPSIPEVELQGGRLLGLAGGRLTEGTPAPPIDPPESALSFRITAGHAALDAVVATFPGVVLQRLGDRQYRMSVDREVALAPLMRALVRAGVAVHDLERKGARGPR